jgi:hypothetical protein
MAFFLKTNVMIKLLNNLALFRVKKTPILSPIFFPVKILQIIPSVPGVNPTTQQNEMRRQNVHSFVGQSQTMEPILRLLKLQL